MASNSMGSLVAIALCACALSALAARDLAEDSSMVMRHEHWMAKYRRVYNDATEKSRRLEVFKANVAFIESVNARNDKFWLEANQFADITNDEFRATHTGHKLSVGGSKAYTGADGTCSSNRTSSSAASIKGHDDVLANDEASLQKAVAAQPVSVALDGGDDLFRFYKGGVLSGDCGTELDHGVAAVGYGVADDGTKFWVIKNSWGTSWGEDGYIRMERDVTDKQGLCGLAMQPSYPTA
uniref:Uncharacterized protein n=1 Tax=Avena sativa TaxID=4498 RepID=A0ACD5UJT1_AVESA